MIGITIGSPIGLYLLKYLSSDVTHISVCVLVIFFSFLLITSIQPAVIRGSLAALFFLTDIYAFVLSSLAGIVDITTIYRILPLITILPIGVYIGDKFFVKSKEETYRKVVFYFLIFISILGIFRFVSNI